MKYTIALLSLVSVAYGGYVGGAIGGYGGAIGGYGGAIGGHAIGAVNTGASSVHRQQDSHGNYAFGYNEDHATGGTFRRETGAPGFQAGSYGLRDADGRHRVVNYVADALGYRVNIQTNEPGVDPTRVPAATSINGHVYAGPIGPSPYDGGYGGAIAHGGDIGLAGGYGAGIAHGGAIGLAGGYGAGIAHGGAIGYGGAIGHGVGLAGGYGAGLAGGHGGW